MAGGQLPSGTVTFLFTDIVDSTRLWEQRAGEMADAVARHDRILGDAVTRHAGVVVKSQGDGLMAAFDDADAAVGAAVDGQRALGDEDWSVPLAVRMGLCTGPARETGGDYHGPVVNRAARTAAAAHPGQILVAPATAVLVESFALRDLGEYQLKGLPPMRLSQVLAAGIVADFPPLSVPPVGVGVAAATQFVGRARELESVDGLVADHSFVTLTGVGGGGKTRMAIEVARLVSSRFPDGVRFADLAVITEPDGVADAVAGALGLVDDGGARPPISRVAEHLQGRAILCILDNCEHVIDACAELAEAVIARPGASRVLATSREPLGVPGEQVFLVPSLDVTTDAVELFAARAAEVRPDFALDETSTDTVAKICERLDGIPLAIELAAARVSQLSLAQLLERLSDRFRLLTGGRRRVQRQQTLAAALDWSHDLLDEHEQVLLRRLGVFPGSFTLEAAEQVAGVDDILALGSLVTKSLAQVVESGERFRYRLLETVRLYATEKLADAGEADDLRSRHARWVLDSLESVPLEQRWFGDVAGVVDMNNVRAALEWSATAGSPSVTAGLASGVMWTRSGQWREGIQWCESVANADELDARTRLQVLMTLFQLHPLQLSRHTGPRLSELAEQAESIAEGLIDPLVPFMWAFRGSTGASLAEGTQDAALAELVAEWMEIGVAMSDPFELPWRIYCRLCAGMGYTTLRRPEAAEHHLEAAVALAQQLEGYDALRDNVRAYLSVHRVLAGDLDRAAALVDGIPILPSAPSFFDREGALSAVVARAAGGDPAGARRRLAACYADALRTDLPLGVGETLVFGAAIAALSGDWDTGGRLLAASRDGYRRSPFSYMLYLTFRDRVRAAVGVDRARELRDEGRRLSRDEAVALALGDYAA